MSYGQSTYGSETYGGAQAQSAVVVVQPQIEPPALTITVTAHTPRVRGKAVPIARHERQMAVRHTR